MRSAKLFKNGQSQAVRLPKEFRFEGEEVWIQQTPQGVLLTPKRLNWDGFFECLDSFSDDFLIQREQLPPQQRQKL